jgi:glycosyltransferase involved in cell wall biosynthesis
MAATTKPRRVLMLCYYYPPVSSAGTQRSVGFTRWLGECGWIPVVLTVRQSRIPWEPSHEDVPAHVEVVRTVEWNLQGAIRLVTGAVNRVRDWLELPRRPSVFYTWCLPDLQIAWLSTLRGIVLARACECVYVSCSPFSSALSGCVIKLATGRPLILDFRDPWALNPYSYHSPRQRRILRWLEHWVIKTCDALILNTPGAERLYRARYPELADKMTCVPNGFDQLNVAPASRCRDRFTIMHVGDFYRTRTPERLLDALCELNDPQIEFVQLGPSSDVFDRYKDRISIRHIERVRHEEALKLMQTASLLYLVQGWEDGVTDYVSIASKTYEYLATGIPVLAEVPPGDNEAVIRRYATRAWVVTSRSVDAVCEAVREARAVADQCEPMVTDAFVETFDRRRLTEQLSAVLDRALSPSAAAASGGTPSRSPDLGAVSNQSGGG